MRTAKHNRSKASRPKRANAPDRQWEKLKLRISTLRCEAEENRRKIHRLRRVHEAFKSDSPAEDVAGSFVKGLKARYSETALAHLANDWSYRLNVEKGQSCAIDIEASSLLDTMLSFTDDEATRKILTGDCAGEVPLCDMRAVEILDRIEKNGLEYLNAVRRLEKERNQQCLLQSKARDYLLSCPPEIQCILRKVEETEPLLIPENNEQPLRLFDSEDDVEGWDRYGLEKMPPPDVLAVISPNPERVTAAVNNVRRMTDSIIASYADVLCLTAKEAAKIKTIPSIHRIKELNSLRSEFPGDEWNDSMQAISVEARETTSVSALRDYLNARKHSLDITRRSLLFPKQYRSIPPFELLKRASSDPHLTKLDSLLPPFALKLPEGFHSQVLNMHSRLRSLIAGHPELSLGRMESDTLADIVMFGFYRFGDFGPHYSMEDVYETVCKSRAWNEGYEKFAEFFEKKLFPLRNYIFRHSMEKNISPATLVLFQPAAAIGWDNFGGAATRALYHAAREGNETARRLLGVNSVRLMLSKYAHVSYTSRSFWNEIVSVTDDSRYDIARAVQIASSASNRRHIFTAGWNGNEWLLRQTALYYCFYFTVSEAEYEREALRWACDLGLNDPAELCLRTITEFDRLFVEGGLSDLYETMRRTREFVPHWRSFLDLFETFYSEHSAYLDQTGMMAEEGLSEVEMWRSENEY